MAVEIEAKLKVESHSEVLSKLEELGAVHVGLCRQVDCYLDNNESELRLSDSCLRLRAEYFPNKSECVICYKGPKLGGEFKEREEIETCVSDSETAISLFERIGYCKSLAFDKTRDLWEYKGCQVCLDTLPLIGPFVEIEGIEHEKVSEVKCLIGLGEFKHNESSYACQIEKALADSGSESREVYL